jgi:uncharacterized protein YjbI with pentapeptide repeats
MKITSSDKELIKNALLDINKRIIKLQGDDVKYLITGADLYCGNLIGATLSEADLFDERLDIVSTMAQKEKVRKGGKL